MFMKKSAILATAMFATSASTVMAGPPGENTNGSTTVTLQASTSGNDACVVQQVQNAGDTSFDSADGSSGDAWAEAVAMASNSMSLEWQGDIELDVVRHGINGAVFQVDLEGAMSTGQLSVMTSGAEALAALNLDAEASAEAEEFVQAVAGNLYNLSAGLDILIASVQFNGEAGMVGASNAGAEAQAIASTQSAAEAQAAALATAQTGSDLTVGKRVYVQGANIEIFNAGITLQGTGVSQVEVTALADVVANAYATAVTVAAAEAMAQAEVGLGLEFCVEILGDSACIPLFSISDAAMDFANELVSHEAEIQAFAESYAQAYASVLTQSQMTMSAQVQYENLPGLDDLYTLTGSGQGVLVCGDANAEADAEAEAGVETL